MRHTRNRRRYRFGHGDMPTGLRVALIVLFSSVALYSLYQLISDGIRSSRTKRAEAGMQAELIQTLDLDETPEPAELQEQEQEQAAAPTPKPTPDPGVLGPAISANPDTVGALIAGSYIKTYVVQRDNSFYLTHGFTGEENRAGAIFADQGCRVSPYSRHILIHGHNMNDGTSFGKLKEYRNQSYLNEFPTIRFVTPYEDATYVIFSVLAFSVNEENSDYFSIFKFNFSSDSDFISFAGAAKGRSQYAVPVDVTAEDTLLTLMTCYTAQNDQRIAVMARKLRDGETAEQFANMFPAAQRDLYYQPGHSLLSGSDVLLVQQALTKLGYSISACDGVYGAETARAVTEFQRDQGLPADGMVGKKTRALLLSLSSDTASE